MKQYNDVMGNKKSTIKQLPRGWLSIQRREGSLTPKQLPKSDGRTQQVQQLQSKQNASNSSTEHRNEPQLQRRTSVDGTQFQQQKSSTKISSNRAANHTACDVTTTADSAVQWVSNEHQTNFLSKKF